MPNESNQLTPTPSRKTHSRKSKGRAFWLAHVEAWKKSGLEKAAYCRQHDLATTTLYNWSAKFRKEGVLQDAFVPVAVEQPAQPVALAPVREQDSAIDIRLPNGVQISVPAGSDPSFVLPWVSRLASLQ